MESHDKGWKQQQNHGQKERSFLPVLQGRRGLHGAPTPQADGSPSRVLGLGSPAGQSVPEGATNVT